jgi:hypothetical protein
MRKQAFYLQNALDGVDMCFQVIWPNYGGDEKDHESVSGARRAINQEFLFAYL